MAEFALRIVTPEGLRYDGVAEKLVVRTVAGDVAILPGHIHYVAPLGMGKFAITVAGEKRSGSCIGGLVSVVDGKVTIVPATFEWAEDIDILRAKRAEAQAKAVLNDKDSTEADRKLAAAQLKRALLRQHAAAHKPK